MAHDATKVLLGAVGSNEIKSFAIKGTIAAGKAVRLKSDGTVTTVLADGNLLGISRGRDLSNTNQISVVAAGLRVPVLVGDSFTPAKGAAVYIDDASGVAVASATDSTVVNAVYFSSLLSGIDEDGSTQNVAIIDFAGGL